MDADCAQRQIGGAVQIGAAWWRVQGSGQSLKSCTGMEQTASTTCDVDMDTSDVNRNRIEIVMDSRSGSKNVSYSFEVCLI